MNDQDFEIICKWIDLQRRLDTAQDALLQIDHLLQTLSTEHAVYPTYEAQVVSVFGEVGDGLLALLEIRQLFEIGPTPYLPVGTGPYLLLAALERVGIRRGEAFSRFLARHQDRWQKP